MSGASTTGMGQILAIREEGKHLAKPTVPAAPMRFQLNGIMWDSRVLLSSFHFLG